jgi:hypothetical protein
LPSRLQSSSNATRIVPIKHGEAIRRTSDRFPAQFHCYRVGDFHGDLANHRG